MTGAREKWFSRPGWYPINLKGWLFYLFGLPILFGLFFLMLALADNGPPWAGGLALLGLLVVVMAANIFIVGRSR